MADDRTLRIRLILEAANRFTKPLRELVGGAATTRKQLAETRSELKALQQQQAHLDSYRRFGAAVDAEKAKLAEARTELADLAAKMAAAETPSKRLAASFAAAEDRVAKFERKLLDADRGLKTHAEALKVAGTDLGALDAHERDLGERVAATTRRLEQQAGALETVSKRSQRLTAAREAFGKTSGRAANLAASGFSGVMAGREIAAPIVSVTHDAVTFEQETSMIDMLLAGKYSRGNSIDRIRTDLVALSKRTPMSAVDLAVIAQNEARAGIKDNQLVQATEDAAKMGLAFKMTAEEAGKMNATLRTAMQMSRDDVRRLGDQVIGLTQKFGGNAQAIAEVITTMGPVSKVANLSSGALAALAAMEVRLGNAPEVAATGIKNVLVQLAGATAARKRAREAYAALGLDPTGIAKQMQVDSTGTILKVFERIARQPKFAQLGTLTKLFGRESLGAIAPLLANLDDLQQRLDLVSDAKRTAGTVDREYDRFNRTTAAELEKANNNFTALKITLGTQLLPTIIRASRWVGRLASSFDSWAKLHPTLARGLMIGAVALAAFLVVGGALAITMAALLAPFGALSAVARLFGTNTVGLFAGGAGRIARIARFLAVAFGRGLMLMYGFVEWFVGAVSVKLAEAALWLGPKLWAPFARGAALFGRLALFVGRAAWGLALTIGRAGLALLANPLVLLIAAIAVAIGVAGFLIWKHWGTIKGAFASGLAYLAGLWGRFRDFGGHLIQGLVDGIRAKLAAVKDAVVGAAQQAVGWFKEKLGIHSPSRVFFALGGHLMGGLSGGIADGRRGPIDQIDALARRLSAPLPSPTIAIRTLAQRLPPAPPAARETPSPLGGRPVPLPPSPFALRAPAQGTAVARLTAPPEPTRRVERLSRRVATAITASTAAAGLVGAPAPAAAPRRPTPPPAAPGPLVGTLHIHPAPGMDEHRLADLVMRKLREVQARDRARSRSRYEDDLDEDSTL